MSDEKTAQGAEKKSNATLSVSVKIHPVKPREPREGEKDNLLAFASVTLGGCFAINDIRVMNSAKGPFMAMPSKKGADGQFHDTCFPVTAQMRKDLTAAVMGEFQRVTQKQSVRGDIQNGQREAAARPPVAAQKTTDKGAR